ncbi:hypothetical protein N7507_010403 [Penicillium longicatenatum]|nr:hypothetical protein N7507_010403 [Penicillium longicatenatum]
MNLTPSTKLSVKLFTFYRKLQNVNESIQNLSKDVALTCAILRELGESLKQDEQSRLCSPEAYRTAQHVLKQCEEVLQQIQKMINKTGPSVKTRWQQAANKLRSVLNEPNVHQLRGNLERLKSTMFLLLNVIMNAGQIDTRTRKYVLPLKSIDDIPKKVRHSYDVPTMLHEQRALIESLLEEKKKIEANPSKSQAGDVDDANTNMSSIQSHANVFYPSYIFNSPSPLTYDTTVQMPPSPIVTDNNQELHEYDSLIKTMLREIDRYRYKLEQGRHARIRTGVLNIHSGKIVNFQRTYGPSVFRLFNNSLFE